MELIQVLVCVAVKDDILFREIFDVGIVYVMLPKDPLSPRPKRSGAILRTDASVVFGIHCVLT